MSEKYEDARLILELYNLRREPVMRKARDWFFSFNPESIEEFEAVLIGEHSAYYRMVTTYWDMAASLVGHAAIDEQMFNDANGEHLSVFAKVEPFLPELRKLYNLPTYLSHLEKLVLRMPDAKRRTAETRERVKRFAALRAGAAEARSLGVRAEAAS
jgi:hypothetical protein